MTDNSRSPEETAEPIEHIRALIEDKLRDDDVFLRYYGPTSRYRTSGTQLRMERGKAFREHLAALDRLADPALTVAIQELDTCLKMDIPPSNRALQMVFDTLTALRSPAHE